MATQTTLFDYVIVVGLKQESGGSVVPFVKWRFPQTNNPKEKDPFAENITKFCFPDIDEYPKAKIKGDSFSFVLTESDGAKRWGYCRRVLEPGDGKRFPNCFCIVSFIIFSTILDEVIERGGTGGNTLNVCSIFLDAVYKKPLPPPGGTIQVTMTSLRDLKPEHFFFTRPDDSDSMFDYVNFEPLLHLLDPINILSIFTSLLIERRIIFLADELSTLSACVQAAAALLYPFSWQHIFIPVLPPALLSFCCAPMPFVVGVLRSAVPELNKMSSAMEEVVMVDLDRNKFLSDTAMQDYGLLPAANATPLLKALAKACKSVKAQYSLKSKLQRKAKAKAGLVGELVNVGTSVAATSAPVDKEPGKMSRLDAKDLANAFIAFFVDLTGSYRSYIKPKKENPQQLGFDREQFLEAQPPEARRLLELFVESQMFEMFVQERAKTKRLNTGKFEQRVTMYIERGSAEKPRGPPGSAHSRFTMYERGEITREEITKSLHEIEQAEKRAPAVVPKTNWVHEGASATVDLWTTAPIIRQGPLNKLGGHLASKVAKIIGNWQTKWFVLTTQELAYFKNKEDMQPSGIIPLSDILMVNFAPQHELTKRTNCLELRVPGRIFFLTTETREDGEQWQDAIIKQLGKAKEHGSTISAGGNGNSMRAAASSAGAEPTARSAELRTPFTRSATTDDFESSRSRLARERKAAPGGGQSTLGRAPTRPRPPAGLKGSGQSATAGGHKASSPSSSPTPVRARKQLPPTPSTPPSAGSGLSNSGDAVPTQGRSPATHGSVVNKASSPSTMRPKGSHAAAVGDHPKTTPPRLVPSASEGLISNVRTRRQDYEGQVNRANRGLQRPASLQLTDEYSQELKRERERALLFSSSGVESSTRGGRPVAGAKSRPAGRGHHAAPASSGFATMRNQGHSSGRAQDLISSGSSLRSKGPAQHDEDERINFGSSLDYWTAREGREGKH